MIDIKQMIFEWGGHNWTYEELHGKDWEDFLNVKDPPIYEKWYAAQKPKPNIEKHGNVGECSIVTTQDPVSHTRLGNYFVVGQYADGSVLSIPFESHRKAASIYMHMHRITKLDKEWNDLESSEFRDIKKVGKETNGPFRIMKMADGFWLYDSHNAQKTNGIESHYRVGPFSNKALARKYGLEFGFEFDKEEKENDEVKEVKKISYPAFVFSYKFERVDCVDIVRAEDEKSAMKRFYNQWMMFDNQRPYKSINTIDDLNKALRFNGYTDIEIKQIETDDELAEYVQKSKEIGNPSTNSVLKKYCKNRNFKYILGPDTNTGRIPITLTYNKFLDDPKSSKIHRI